MFFKKRAERIAENFFYRAARFNTPQFRLGLPFKLYFAELYGHDGSNLLAHIVAGKNVVCRFNEIIFLPVFVQGARERGAEARKMRSPFGVVGIVRERKLPRRNIVNILERRLDDNFLVFRRGFSRFLSRILAFYRFIYIKDVLMNRSKRLVVKLYH